MRGKRRRRGGQFKDLQSGVRAFKSGLGDLGGDVRSVGRDTAADTKGILEQARGGLDQVSGDTLKGVNRMASLGHGALDTVGHGANQLLDGAGDALDHVTRQGHKAIEKLRKRAKGGRKSRRHRGGSRRTRRRKGGRRRTRKRGGRRRRSRRGGRRSRRRMRGGGCGCSGGAGPLVGGRRRRRR